MWHPPRAASLITMCSNGGMARLRGTVYARMYGAMACAHGACGHGLAEIATGCPPWPVMECFTLLGVGKDHCMVHGERDHIVAHCSTLGVTHCSSEGLRMAWQCMAGQVTAEAILVLLVAYIIAVAMLLRLSRSLDLT